MTHSSPELTVVEKKAFYKSWTFWFNAVLLVLTFVVDARFHDDLIALGVSEITAARVLLLGNLGLRFISSAQLTLGVFRRDP